MKVTSRVYSNAPTPLPGQYPAISIPTGQFWVQKVPFYGEGRLQRLVVKQLSGTSVAFSVDVLASAYPYNNTTNGITIAGFTATDDPEFYKIVPTQAGTSGSTVEIISNSTGYPFINMDGTPTNTQGYIYVVITPTSAGGTTVWGVGLTGIREIG